MEKYMIALDQGPQVQGVFYLIMADGLPEWHRKNFHRSFQIQDGGA